MSKAKEIMHRGARVCRGERHAGGGRRMMRDRHVGALPICGPDNRLQGISF
jgi:hypothetical protein